MGWLIPFLFLRCMLSVFLTAAAVGGLIWLAPGREFTTPSMQGFGAVVSAPTQGTASTFVWNYCLGLLSGDAGISTSFQVPVATLIRERLSDSFLTLVRSLVALLIVSSMLATIALRNSAFRAIARLLMGVLYSIPVGLFALPLAYLPWPPELAVVAGTLPKVFSLLDAVFERASRAPHLVWMQSMGVGWIPSFWYGILRAARAEIFEIVALSIPLLLGTLIVVEVLAGQPGVGTLAWRAVQARDLPLLGAITILFAMASSLAAAAATLCSREVGP